MIEAIIIIILIGIICWVRHIQKKLETHDKLSQLAESIMWNTLLENKVINQGTYDEALERFNKNVHSALSTGKQKQAQVRALEALLKNKQNGEKK